MAVSLVKNSSRKMFNMSSSNDSLDRYSGNSVHNKSHEDISLRKKSRTRNHKDLDAIRVQ